MWWPLLKYCFQNIQCSVCEIFNGLEIVSLFQQGNNFKQARKKSKFFKNFERVHLFDQGCTVWKHLNSSKCSESFWSWDKRDSALQFSTLVLSFSWATTWESPSVCPCVCVCVCQHFSRVTARWILPKLGQKLQGDEWGTVTRPVLPGKI